MPVRRPRWRSIVGWASVVLLAPILLFLISAWIGSAIPRNSDWEEPAQGIEIMVGTNGVHTEIAMPIHAAGFDWRAYFSPTDIADPGRPYTHVAVSWGERDFFLETPTWSDLNPLTAVSALIGGDSVMHVAFYVRPAPSDDYRVLRLSPEQYRALAGQIAGQLAPLSARQTYPGYADHDAFYDASGTYNAARTCNQWTSDQLANAGIKAGSWTPLSGGVMRWIPRTDER